MACVFCETEGGVLLWRDTLCRVVRADEAGYPAFCRVIWNAHAAEMTDLAPREREHCMRVVFALEHALRELLQPDKVNLASLGNVVAHVHWHVVARWRDDAHFPKPVWSEVQRTGQVRALPADFERSLAAQLNNLLAGGD